jgi:hypothetical protein
MRTIDNAERRARLGRRHHLASSARDVDTAADAIVGLHSSDPVTVFLAARARVRGFAVEDLEGALYERRSLVRMWGMRRTLFVTPRSTAAVMDAACAKASVAPERRRLLAAMTANGDADPERRLDALRRRVYEALAARGEASAVELTVDVPELRTKLTYGAGTRSETQVGLSTRVLFLLALEARILRARPLGSWISGQYRWAPLAAWLGEDLPMLDAPTARAELLRRWLRAFGPGTSTDVTWWSGWTRAESRAALGEVGAVEVALEDGGAGWVLPDDVRPVRAPSEPWIALLPGLDPTVMGWKERGWFLGPHAELLFDRNGNAGPTVWVDGRVVGGWAVVAPGEVGIRLLEDPGRDAREAIEREATRLSAWLGATRVTPRFRTPLERHLTG